MAFPLPFGQRQPQDPTMMPPRVPWGQNPVVTMAGLGLVSGRNLNEGLANLAQTVPAGMAAKSGMQQFMLAQQERQAKKAEEDARRSQMNEVIKNWSGIPEPMRAYYLANPDQFGSYVQSTMKTPELPNSVQEYQYGQKDPAYNDWRTSLSQASAPKTVGAPPPGYAVKYDAAGNPIAMEPIKGGPADTSAKDALREAGQRQKADIVTQDIDRTLKTIEASPGLTTGIGGTVMSAIPGSSANNVSALLDTVKANVGFEQLSAMRAASPTGGALGAVSERENALLQSVLGSVEQSQSPEQLTYNLKRLKNIYLDIVHGPGQGPPREPLDGEAAGGASDIPVPDGVDPGVWEYMTPEQKALWK